MIIQGWARGCVNLLPHAFRISAKAEWYESERTRLSFLFVRSNIMAKEGRKGSERESAKQICYRLSTRLIQSEVLRMYDLVEFAVLTSRSQCDSKEDRKAKCSGHYFLFLLRCSIGNLQLGC